MSDARWIDIDRSIASAVHHFRGAAGIFEALQAGVSDLDRYTAEMGFMHAMQAGHSSLEAALLRILDLFQEEPPSGPRWHADLIQRVSVPTDRRPPILGGAMADAADETRQFRNVASRAYDNFKLHRAHDAVAAARLLANGVGGVIDAFRARVDP
jgi:hypothetical protein